MVKEGGGHGTNLLVLIDRGDGDDFHPLPVVESAVGAVREDDDSVRPAGVVEESDRGRD